MRGVSLQWVQAMRGLMETEQHGQNTKVQSVASCKNGTYYVFPLAFNQFAHKKQLTLDKPNWEERIQTANNTGNIENMGRARIKAKLNVAVSDIDSSENNTN